MIVRAVQRLLHAAVNQFQRARRRLWFVTRPQTSGVHAAALTPEGKLILVTLSYARGWRLPGGGLKQGEDPERAVLRELREEIDLLGHGSVQKVADFHHRPDFRRGHSALFVVKDVSYRSKWSLEIKVVAEFDPKALPPDTAPITRRMLAAAADWL